MARVNEEEVRSDDISTLRELIDGLLDEDRGSDLLLVAASLVLNDKLANFGHHDA